MTRCLGARPVIKSPAELRRWCLFYFRVFRAVNDYPQQWDCDLDGDSGTWADALLLGGPLVLVWREHSESEIAEWVTRFCHATFRRRSRPAYAATSGDYTRLMRLVWDHMREMGTGWPSEPGALWGVESAEKALAAAMEWCDAQARGDEEGSRLPVPAPERRPAPEVEKPEWSEPEGPQQWAKVFGVSYKTMKRWLDKQVICNRQLSPRRYRVRKDELP